MAKQSIAPAWARRQLRTRLRSERDRAGLKREDVGALLDWSVSKILRIENGKSLVGTTDLQALLRAYEVPDQEWEDLIELARTSRQPTLSTQFRDVTTKTFNEWLEFEQLAESVRQYETKLIPGILQIHEYARDIVSQLGPDLEEGQVERIVEARRARAEALTGSQGPEIEFIIDEGALRRGVGNRGKDPKFEVMGRVFDNIKRLNTRGRILNGEPVDPALNPRISVQIMPLESGAYPALRGPFEILEFKEPTMLESMVYEENPRGDDIIREESAETLPYFEKFDAMLKVAPGPEKTNGMIDDIWRLMKAGLNGVAMRDEARVAQQKRLQTLAISEN